MKMKNEVQIIGLDENEWAHLISRTPTLAEERWRIVDEGDRWVVWFIPLNHPELWAEIGHFETEQEAVAYFKSY